MKKIITAINNPRLNEELKKENKFEVIGKDIQYREAISEILEENEDIDIIIINEKIPGEINLKNLIKKIKTINEKIKIIFILETENIETEKILIENNIFDIYYNNKINLEELIKIINKKEISMEEEIILLRKIIEEKNTNKKIKNNKKNKSYKNNKNNKNNYNNYYNNKELIKYKNNILIKIKNKIFNKSNKKIINNKTKIISFSGNCKSGKTTLSLAFSNYLKNKNNKVLLIDMDLEKNDLTFILKKEKYLNKNKKEKNIIKNKQKINKNIKNNNKENNKKILYLIDKKIKLINKNNKIFNLAIKKYINIFIKKINKNLYLLLGINLFLENKKSNNNIEKNISELLKILKIKKFDFILIDLGNNNKKEINKEVLKKCDINFIIMESNQLGIRELQRNIKFYTNDEEIEKNSLHIIKNMDKINLFNKHLIYNIFPEIKKIYEINENKIYKNLINGYFKNYYLLKNKKVNKDINKISNKIAKGDGPFWQ